MLRASLADDRRLRLRIISSAKLVKDVVVEHLGGGGETKLFFVEYLISGEIFI